MRLRDRAAFTIIELMVVVVILVVLIGLILPALGASRQAARSAVCLSQIRQIGMATQIYARDNDDLLPRSSHSSLAHGVRPWGYVLYSYIRHETYPGRGPGWDALFNGLYRCPEDERVREWSYGKSVWFELTPGETGEVAGMTSGPTYYRLRDIPRVTATVLFGELKSGSSLDHIMPHFWLMGGSPEVDMDRHGGMSNYAFVDGHAESLEFSSTFDLERSIDQWDPGRAR